MRQWLTAVTAAAIMAATAGIAAVTVMAGIAAVTVMAVIAAVTVMAGTAAVTAGAAAMAGAAITGAGVGEGLDSGSTSRRCRFITRRSGGAVFPTTMPMIPTTGTMAAPVSTSPWHRRRKFRVK